MSFGLLFRTQEGALQSETRLREQVGRRARYEEELKKLRDQLDECRKERSSP